MISKVLTLIVVLTSSLCFARDTVDDLDDGIINEIVSNKNTCVVDCSEDKIYLNPNRIFPTEQGLYLNLNDVDYVLLPILNSDSNGCYVPVPCVNIYNKCPGCSLDYLVYCKNPKCPLKLQNQEREREKERKKEDHRAMKKEKKKDRK
jgi:hypothetical protein